MMGFWSSETLHSQIEDKSLISPFDPEAIKNCAYELALGPETFVTSTPEGTKRILEAGGQLRIPPGQFGLLMTGEKVKVPCDAIAFISMRSVVKFQGLINISGFHVDPGFEGQLKFSVYNAGSQPVVLDYGQRIFLIWYCNLDCETQDGYTGAKEHQTSISGKEVSALQGEIASPGALKMAFDALKQDYKEEFEKLRLDSEKRISAMEAQVNLYRGVVIAVGVGILMLLVATLNKASTDHSGAFTTGLNAATATPLPQPIPTQAHPKTSPPKKF